MNELMKIMDRKDSFDSLEPREIIEVMKLKKKIAGSLKIRQIEYLISELEDVVEKGKSKGKKLPKIY